MNSEKYAVRFKAINLADGKYLKYKNII